MSDRGQSETLGYVLVFSVILLTVGTVYAGGFSELEDSRQHAQLRNMERAFDVLADNARDIYRHGAPRRATEIKLGEGAVGFGEQVAVQVNATEVGNASNNVSSPPVTVRPITYETDRERVVYSNGAVFLQGPDGAVMRTAPRWIVSDDQLSIPLVITTPAVGGRSLDGPGTVLVATEGRTPTPSIAFTPPNETRVNVTIRSTRARAWERHFDDRADRVRTDFANDTVVLTFVTDRVSVVRTGITVSFRA